jgi:hypothetical protein
MEAMGPLVSRREVGPRLPILLPEGAVRVVWGGCKFVGGCESKRRCYICLRFFVDCGMQFDKKK